jgi:hypothetical protein
MKKQNYSVKQSGNKNLASKKKNTTTEGKKVGLVANQDYMWKKLVYIKNHNYKEGTKILYPWNIWRL